MTERADPDVLLEHLRELDAETDGLLTWDRMDAAGDYHPSTYSAHFGSWSAAKRKAGIEDEDDTRQSAPNTAKQSTALTTDAQSFIISHWRDLRPLLEHDAACSEGEGFEKRNLPDCVQDIWQAAVTVDGFLRKMGRFESDSTRYCWRLTTPARDALEQRVKRYERERDKHGDKTPLPCSCYPLAVSNHGDTIECRHCNQEFARERCGSGSDSTDDGVAVDHSAPEAGARTDGGRDSEYCATTTTNSDPNHSNDDSTTAADGRTD